MKIDKTNRWLLFVVLLTIAFISIISLIPKIFTTHELIFQIVAVILSVIFTSLITLLLLDGQSKQQSRLLEEQSKLQLDLLEGQSKKEEERDKNVKIHENKINTYSSFISKMWKTLEDDTVKESERDRIRSEIFNKLIFYLNENQIDLITDALKKWKDGGYTDELALVTFGEITNILRNDILSKTSNKESVAIKKLWNCFTKEPEKDDKTETENNNWINSSIDTDPNNNRNDSPELQEQVQGKCYHFNIGDKTTQYRIFKNGVNALFLWEYNQTWRAERLKNINENEIVFLYQNGGPGYVGIFLAKGWVHIESSGDGKISNRQSSNNIDSNSINDDNYCFKEYLEDGCTSIAYLIVEPLIFYENGIGRVGGVYRYTISSLWNHYAWIYLKRFKELKDKETINLNTFTYNNQKFPLNCNDEDFKQLIKKNHI